MEKIKYFDNTMFNNIDSGGYDKSVVKGQFPTGCADPYIMRYNGMFYLYVTTSGLQNYGLRAWKSKDLLNWVPCQGKGLPLGYVVDNKDEDGRYTQNAYAPEVYYFNGKFYMIISPGPAAVSPLRGHRILVSDSPEGPFMAHSEQIDKRIDGSLLIDDDESVYFFHATPFGITVHEFKDMKELGEGALIKASNGTGAWTEGPGITKVRGYYYLTYTGCHYQTPGYQVIYAYTDNIDKTNIQTVADSFKIGASRVVLLNCDKDEGHVGLGHSINFMGPDLDSYYICYHNLDALYEDGMTHRSFNIDRLLVGNGLMTSVQNRTGTVYPKFPFFESFGLEGFEKLGNKYLSNKESKKRFSAEFNSRKGGDVKYLFSYVDEKNYMFIHIDYQNKRVELFRIENGVSKLLEQGTLRYQYSINDNQTIRVAYDGELNVYFNNLLKISVKLDLEPGKIGYEYQNDNIEIGYSAISDEANGSSDRNEIKQALGETPAFDYNNASLSRGSDLYSLNGLHSEYSYTKGMKLVKKSDYLEYELNFKEDAHYGIVFNLEDKYFSKSVLLSLDGQENKVVIPKADKSSKTIRSVLVDFGDIKKGVHTLRIENVENEFAFVSFYFTPYKNEFSYRNSFASNMDGINPVTDGYRIENIELVVEGRRNFAFISHQLLTDVSMEAVIRLDSITEEKGSIGMMLRQNNYAYSDVPNQDFKDANTHIQGYYLEIKENKINISKFNFGDVKSYALDSKEFKKSLLGKEHKYTFKIVEDVMDIYMDDVLLFHVIDKHAFHVGAASLYSYRSKGAYKNLKIDTISK